MFEIFYERIDKQIIIQLSFDGKKLGYQKVPELVFFDNVVKIYTLLGFKKTDDTNGQALCRLIEQRG